MHELAPRTPGRDRLQATLHKVFDRLHVVVRLAFDALYLRRVGVGKVGREGVERGQGLRGKTPQFQDRSIRGERLEPERLDANALADEPALAEDRAQLSGLVGVAAVNRRNRVQCMVVHCLQERFAASGWSQRPD